MAKEVAPTPILRGKEATTFLLEMAEPASDKKKKMLKNIREEYEPIF